MAVVVPHLEEPSAAVEAEAVAAAGLALAGYGTVVVVAGDSSADNSMDTAAAVSRGIAGTAGIGDNTAAAGLDRRLAPAGADFDSSTDLGRFEPGRAVLSAGLAVGLPVGLAAILEQMPVEGQLDKREPVAVERHTAAGQHGQQVLSVHNWEDRCKEQQLLVLTA